MYDIAICDACEESAGLMRRRIWANAGGLADIRVHLYHSGRELLDAMRFVWFSLIILDIQIKGTGGQETAERIRERDRDVVLVYQNGNVEPSLRSFKMQPFRYIMKNMPDEDVDQYIKASLNQMAILRRMPKLEARKGGRELYLLPDDIVYIEKYRKITKAYLSRAFMEEHEFEEKEGPDVRIMDKLGNLYPLLRGFGFGYPHDSYLINFRYLTCCTERMAELEGFRDKPFKIARSKSEEFQHLREVFSDVGMTEEWGG